MHELFVPKESRCFCQKFGKLEISSYNYVILLFLEKILFCSLASSYSSIEYIRWEMFPRENVEDWLPELHTICRFTMEHSRESRYGWCNINLSFITKSHLWWCVVFPHLDPYTGRHEKIVKKTSGAFLDSDDLLELFLCEVPFFPIFNAIIVSRKYIAC